MSPALTLLIDALADVFETEESPDGRTVAEALRDHRTACPAFDLRVLDMIDETQHLCLSRGAMPAAGYADTIWAMLPWYHPGLDSGNITATVARQMLTCELLGPDGLIFCPDLRVGLFVQAGDVDYPARCHASDETFVMLAGAGLWQCGDKSWRRAGPGEHIHHPSMTAHQSRSDQGPFLAAWRWTGDIGWDSYRLGGLADAA
ncbi:MAG: dimethylsulfonioproprionate lyase family protein [Pseudomonadota bacterium]